MSNNGNVIELFRETVRRVYGYWPVEANEAVTILENAIRDGEDVNHGWMIRQAQRLGIDTLAAREVIDAFMEAWDDMDVLDELRARRDDPESVTPTGGSSIEGDAVREVLADAVRGGMLREDDAVTLLRRMGLGRSWNVVLDLAGFDGDEEAVVRLVMGVAADSGYTVRVVSVTPSTGSTV